MTVISPDGLLVQLNEDICRELAPGSAILCEAGEDGLPVVRNDAVEIWFEGNVHDAVNLTHFIERARCAAGRMMLDYPTTARMHVHPLKFRVLAEFDLIRGIVTSIVDAQGLASQAGAESAMLLPPETPAGGTDNSNAVAEAANLPGGRLLRVDPYVWQVCDGRIIIGPGDGAMRMYGPDDPRLLTLVRDFDDHTRRIISGVGTPTTTLGEPSQH